MIKKKDLVIIGYLRQNARMKLTSMSRKAKLPVSTIFDRIKMNEQGLITKHTSLIDFSVLGFTTRANIMLRVERTDKQGLREFLETHHHVNSLYKINNGFDYLVEAVFRNLNDLEDFLEVLEEKFTLKSKEVHYIIQDIKREGFLADPSLIDLILPKN